MIHDERFRIMRYTYILCVWLLAQPANLFHRLAYLPLKIEYQKKFTEMAHQDCIYELQ